MIGAFAILALAFYVLQLAFTIVGVNGQLWLAVFMPSYRGSFAAMSHYSPWMDFAAFALLASFAFAGYWIATRRLRYIIGGQVRTALVGIGVGLLLNAALTIPFFTTIWSDELAGLSSRGEDVVARDAESPPPDSRVAPSYDNDAIGALESEAPEISPAPATAPVLEEAPLAEGARTAVQAQVARAAEPLRPLETLFSPDDYPASAADNGRQGVTSFAATVTQGGRIDNCRVTSSSGDAALDAATCRILKARARYRPALDSSGAPTEEQVSSSIRWRLE